MSKTTTANPQRATVPVDHVLPNPRNVRKNLKLTDWFLNSVKTNGVKVPLVVVPTGEDTYEVLMGHRRLAAAKSAQLAEVPVYVVDPSLREAGEEFIEMVIENASEGRESLSALEEADALFQAEEAGMSRATVVKKTGRAKGEVEQAVTAAKTVGVHTRRSLEQVADYAWTTDVLAILGEFDDDPAAVDRLITAHIEGYFAHQVTRERDDRAEKQAREQRRAELAAAGVTLVEADDIPQAAEWLDTLYEADGTALDAEAHASCPGHLATWGEDDGDPAAVDYLCADPAAHGHRSEGDDWEAEGSDSDGDADDGQPPAPVAAAAAPAKPKADDGLPYAVKVEGNKAWRAAEKTRRAWLKEFFQRKTAPKALLRFTVEQLYAAPKPVAAWTGELVRAGVLAELLGKEKGADADGRAAWVDANATPGRLALLNFAPYAASFERRISEVQTWRHDKPQFDTEEIRADARVYLRALGEMGYPLSPVEQAVIAGEPYSPEQTAAMDDAEPSEVDASATDAA